MDISPSHITKLKDKIECPHITALRYSNKGDRLILSYNDENIHLFNAKTGEYERTFEGHRNNQTVKGVNFYGENSEFVISGSDCANLYVWDTNTAELVNWQVSGKIFGPNR